MTIIYEDANGLIKLQELLKLAPEGDIKVVVRQLKREEDDLNHQHLVSLLKGQFPHYPPLPPGAKVLT